MIAHFCRSLRPAPPTQRRAILSEAIDPAHDSEIGGPMPTPTSRRAPAADTAAIEARLKQIGGERGESFRVTLPNGDYVYVSPPVAAELKGNVPVIVTEAWQALKPAEQKAHVK